jgi:hypothetical protein
MTRELKCSGSWHVWQIVKSEAVAKKVLTAMHLPTDVPELPGRAAGSWAENALRTT